MSVYERTDDRAGIGTDPIAACSIRTENIRQKHARDENEETFQNPNHSFPLKSNRNQTKMMPRDFWQTVHCLIWSHILHVSRVTDPGITCIHHTVARERPSSRVPNSSFSFITLTIQSTSSVLSPDSDNNLTTPILGSSLYIRTWRLIISLSAQQHNNGGV